MLKWNYPGKLATVAVCALCITSSGYAGKLYQYYIYNYKGTAGTILDIPTGSEFSVIPQVMPGKTIYTIIGDYSKQKVVNLVKFEGDSKLSLEHFSYKNQKIKPIVNNIIRDLGSYSTRTDAKYKNFFFQGDSDNNGIWDYYRTSANGKVSQFTDTASHNLTLWTSLDFGFNKGKVHAFRARLPGETQNSLYLAMYKNPVPLPISSPGANPAASLSGVYPHPKDKGVLFRMDGEIVDKDELYYYDIKKRQTVKITQTMAPHTYVRSFRFDAKGNYLYYTADYAEARKVELFRVDLKTLESTPLNDPNMPPNEQVNTFLRLNPKGTVLYYARGVTGENTAHVYALDLKTGVHTRVTDEGIDITHATIDDMGNIYFVLKDDTTPNTQFRKMDGATGEITPFVSPEIPEGVMRQMAIAENGSGFYYQLEEAESGYTVDYYQGLWTGEVRDLSSYIISIPNKCLAVVRIGFPTY